MCREAQTFLVVILLLTESEYPGFSVRNYACSFVRVRLVGCIKTSHRLGGGDCGIILQTHSWHSVMTASSSDSLKVCSHVLSPSTLTVMWLIELWLIDLAEFDCVEFRKETLVLHVTVTKSDWIQPYQSCQSSYTVYLYDISIFTI